MLKDVKTIRIESLQYFKQLNNLYELENERQITHHIIPTIKYNNCDYSLLSKNVTQTIIHGACLSTTISDCSTYLDIIKTYLKEMNICTQNIFKTIRCFKQFFLLIENQQELKTLLPYFSLSNSNHHLHQLRQICNLDPVIITFCEKKKFSFKQLYQLTLIEKDIIAIFKENIDHFNFSARHFEEVISMSNDLIKRKSLTYSELTTLIKKVKENTKLSNQQQTTQLKKELQELSHPMLTKQNKQISSAINNLSISKKISIDWDKTLENKGITLHTTITSEKDLQEIIDELNSKKTAFNAIIKQT